MKWLIYILVIVALALVALFYLDSAGYVLIYLPIKEKISLEMTFWTFLAIVFLGLLTLFVIYKIYKWVVFLFEPKLEKKAFKSSKKSNSIVLQALANFTDSDFKRSANKLEKAFNLTTSASNAIALFLAYLSNKDFDKARKILQQEFNEYADFLILGDAWLCLAGEDKSEKEANNLQKKLQEKSKTNALFAKTLFEMHKRHSVFVELLEFLTQNKNLNFLTKQQFDFEIKASIFGILSDKANNFELKHDKIEQLEAAQDLDKIINLCNANLEFIKTDLALLRLYAEFLYKQAKFADLDNLINLVLAKDYVGFLLDFFAKSSLGTGKAKIARLNKWRKTHGDRWQLLLALARAYTEADDLEKAEATYLELYKRDADTKIAYELAEFFASQDKMEKSLSFLHQAKVFSSKTN